MSRTVHAIFENGVFRPTAPIDLPENTSVEFELRVSQEKALEETEPISRGLANVYEILGRHYQSGHVDTAERHNEHQP